MLYGKGDLHLDIYTREERVFLYMVESRTPYQDIQHKGRLVPIKTVSNGAIKNWAFSKGVGVDPITNEDLACAGASFGTSTTVEFLKAQIERAEYEADVAHHGDAEAVIVNWQGRNPRDYTGNKSKQKARAVSETLQSVGIYETLWGTLVTDCVWQIGENILNKPDGPEEVEMLLEFYRNTPPESHVYSNTGIAIVLPNVSEQPEFFFLSAYLGHARFAEKIDKVAELVRDPAQRKFAGALRTVDALNELVETPDYITIRVDQLKPSGGILHSGDSFVTVNSYWELIRATPDRFDKMMFASLGVVPPGKEYRNYWEPRK